MLKIIPMLLMVVCVFIVCWSPILIFNVLQSFDVIPTQLFDEYKHVKTSFSLLAYFNSCLNPIIYGFMSATFRQSFKDLLWPQGRIKSYNSNSNNDYQRGWACWKLKGTPKQAHSKSWSSKPFCTCNPSDPFSFCDLHTAYQEPPSNRHSVSGQAEEVNWDVQGRGFEETRFIFQAPSCHCQEKYFVKSKLHENGNQTTILTQTNGLIHDCNSKNTNKPMGSDNISDDNRKQRLRSSSLDKLLVSVEIVNSTMQKRKWSSCRDV